MAFILYLLVFIYFCPHLAMLKSYSWLWDQASLLGISEDWSWVGWVQVKCPNLLYHHLDLYLHFYYIYITELGEQLSGSEGHCQLYLADLVELFNASAPLGLKVPGTTRNALQFLVGPQDQKWSRTFLGSYQGYIRRWLGWDWLVWYSSWYVLEKLFPLVTLLNLNVFYAKHLNVYMLNVLC